MFKRYELEIENERLKEKLIASQNLFAGIYQKCNTYLNKKNCVESLAGLRAIKTMAELGQDIKNGPTNE